MFLNFVERGRNPAFNKTFTDILKGDDPLDIIYQECIENGIRAFNFNILPKTPDTVKKIAPFLLQSMKKEQILIKAKKDYYIAKDTIDNVIYICYKNLLIIDLDNPEKSELEIIEHFKQFKDHSFSIYSSRNGYHVFCVSHKFEYRNLDTVKFMIDNFCDFYYSVHSYIRGFCVRLNRKFTEEKGEIYKFICTTNENLADSHLLELTNKHYKLSKKYSKDEICFPK